MKTTFIATILTLFCFFTNAQTTPEAFLGMLPSAPGNICSEGDDSGKSAFKQAINEAASKLDPEISRRRSESEMKMKANQGKMMQNAMAKTGVSPELTQKMMDLQQKKKNATTAEERKAIDIQMKALTNQLMQESMNMSMDEINSVKKMDKAGKTAWATAYATEKQAEAMADPQALKEKTATATKDYKLIEKQKQLADSLGYQISNFGKQFQELETNQDAVAMQTRITELEAKLSELYKQENRKSDNEIKSVENSIRNIQISYCNLQSPKYLSIVAKYKTFVQTSIRPYSRLEILTNQVNAVQTGVDVKLEPGLMALEQVKAYMKLLGDAYKYNRINSGVKYIGGE